MILLETRAWHFREWKKTVEEAAKSFVDEIILARDMNSLQKAPLKKRTKKEVEARLKVCSSDRNSPSNREKQVEKHRKR